jgi:hypothetical protein
MILRLAIPVALVAGTALAEVNELPDPLFRDAQILEASISGPLTTLVRERSQEVYLPGLFRYVEPDGEEVTLDLKIRTRGNFRHKECDYPPVLLNFVKKQTRDTLFDRQNKLKLVIQCGKHERYEQAVLREYLAYRLLNAVTDRSFRVRLLRADYVNTEKDPPYQQRYAFLIEHKKRLAERLDLNELKIERTSVSAIRPDQLNLTSVFGFFIGNTDFSPIAGPPGGGCCHNYVLFGDDDGPIIPVPYDFDQSGFVDAPYARPDYRFRIRSVRQRLYRGRCANNDYLDSSLRKFRDARETLYTIVSEQEGLTEKVRKDLLRYMDDFYEIINDPRQVDRRIRDRCV